MATTETPFTDEQVDELLKTEPAISSDYESLKICTLGQVLVTIPFYLPPYGAACYHDYNRLIRTASIESLKKLILRNPGIAQNAFMSFAEQGQEKTRLKEDKSSYEQFRLQFQIDRVKLLDWIMEKELVDVNRMLPDLVKFRHIDQMNKILYYARISPHTLHSCLTDLCCYMKRGNWSPEIHSKEQALFDVFFNHPRLDVSMNDNDALSLAVLHKNDYAITKLLSSPKVQECKYWGRVVESAFRVGDEATCRLILEQPNAKFTRSVLRDIKDCLSNGDRLEWVKSHPKYTEATEAADVFKLKSVDELFTRALDICRDDDVTRILKIIKRRLNNEPEDPDVHYDDEREAYVHYDKPWYENN